MTQTYIVKPGDTLSAIALKFYGDARKWPKIWERNAAVILKSQDNDACKVHGFKGPDWIFPRTAIEIETK